MPSKKCKTKWCRNDPVPRNSFCYKCISRRQKEINPTGYFYNILRNNARRRGKEFTLTLAEFRTFCEETNYLELKGRRAHAMSIDRIDHTKGYSYDNIQIMQYAENSSKGNYETNEEDCPF